MPPPVTAAFRFHGNLNDFLPKQQKEKPLTYAFDRSPSIKDAIEAIGVPHTEVAVILVRNAPVPFSYLLQPHDQVEVYPVAAAYTWPDGYTLIPPLPAAPAFVLDVHLGKLAKALRMLGFDTCYRNDYHDTTIANIAASQHRIALTRDVGLLKQKQIIWGYWLRSQHLHEQLAEVMQRYTLQQHLRPLTRCLACNSLIREVPKEQVVAQLPSKTKLYFHEFYQCPNCKRVYWKGSHYERMQAFVKGVAGGG